VELGGSRIGIVLSGSPLFNGGASSGESEILRWILESDWLEAIVALPNDLFYNTGVGTYIWVLSNHKDALRKGKVQLIDASAMHAPMRKSLGSKRKYLSGEQVAEIARLHEAFEDGPNPRSSPPSTSATAASPSSARCACASRSPGTSSPRTATPRVPARPRPCRCAGRVRQPAGLAQGRRHQEARQGGTENRAGLL